MTAVTPKNNHQRLKKHAHLSSPPAHNDDALKEAMRGPQPSLVTRSSLLSDDNSAEDIDRGDPIISPPAPSECSKSISEEKVLQNDQTLFPFASSKIDTPIYAPVDTIDPEDVEILARQPILLQIKRWKPLLPGMPGENYHGQACILSPPKQRSETTTANAGAFEGAGGLDVEVSRDEPVEEKKEEEMGANVFPAGVPQERFVTALHNTQSKDDENGDFIAIQGHDFCAPGLPNWKSIIFPRTNRIPSQAVDLRNGTKWETGKDVCFGPKADVDSIQKQHFGTLETAKQCAAVMKSHLWTTEVVGDTFNYEVGMKVAIAAYCHKKRLDEMPVPRGHRFKRFFGRFFRCLRDEKTSCIMITTGEIKEVCEHHIEYNINTAHGHSGAVVFLIDPTHPDRLKAIAIHAGYHKDLKTNFGFKLKGMEFPSESP